MPRRGGVPKRDVLPDPIYGSTVVTKLVNQVMIDGKKGTAQSIVYDAFDIMQQKLGQEPMVIFNQALENVKPLWQDVLVAQTIKFLSKSDPKEDKLLLFVGSCLMQETEATEI